MNSKYFISFSTIASIFVLCFCIPFAISFYHSLSSEYNYNLMIGRGFVALDAVYYSVQKEPDAAELSAASGSSTSEHFIKHLPDSYDMNDFLIVSQLGVIRAAAYQGDIFLPPILSGRFFTAQESLQSRKLAVIGDSFTDDIWYDHDVPMVTLEYGDYEVIGTVGLQQDSLLDELVFINAGSIEEKTLVSGLFYLDSSSVSSAKLFEDWSSKISSTSIYSIHKIDMSETAVDVISGGIFFSTLLEGIIYSFLILVFLCTLVFFLKTSQARASVLLLNGHSHIHIVKRLSVSVFVAGSSGIFLSIIAGVILAIFGFFRLPSESVLSSVLLASIFSVTAIFLFPVTLFFFVRRIDLAESLR